MSTDVFKSLYFKETSVWLYWSSLLSFCYCWAASFWEKKHPAWSNSVSRAVVYTLCEYFVTVQYCTYLLLSTTWYCMSDKDYTHTQTHRIPYNQSNIVMIKPIALSLALYGVPVYCVQFFHYPVTVHQ